MSNLKDKKLLLLGILSTQNVHGYRLNALLQAPVSPIRVGKANAYQLLAELEKNGFITSHEEQEGNRPRRQVYSLTPAGRMELDSLLRERLAEHVPSELPDAVSLNLINQIEPEEAVKLLKQRRAQIAARCANFAAFSDEVRSFFPGLDYLIRQTELEHKFLSKMIKKYKKASPQVKRA